MVHSRRKLARFGAKPGQTHPTSGRFRARPGRMKPNLVKCSPACSTKLSDKSALASADLGGISTNGGSTSAEVSPRSANLGRDRQSLGEARLANFGSTSTEAGPGSRRIQQIALWATVGGGTIALRSGHLATEAMPPCLLPPTNMPPPDLESRATCNTGHRQIATRGVESVTRRHVGSTH